MVIPADIISDEEFMRLNSLQKLLAKGQKWNWLTDVLSKKQTDICKMGCICLVKMYKKNICFGWREYFWWLFGNMFVQNKMCIYKKRCAAPNSKYSVFVMLWSSICTDWKTYFLKLSQYVCPRRKVQLQGSVAAVKASNAASTPHLHSTCAI